MKKIATYFSLLTMILFLAGCNGTTTSNENNSSTTAGTNTTSVNSAEDSSGTGYSPAMVWDVTNVQHVLAGAVVSASANGTVVGRATTGADGRYNIQGLTAGTTYNFNCTMDGYASASTIKQYDGPASQPGFPLVKK